MPKCSAENIETLAGGAHRCPQSSELSCMETGLHPKENFIYIVYIDNYIYRVEFPFKLIEY